MPSRSLAPALVALCLALAAPGALAGAPPAQYELPDPGPTASFVFFPAAPERGETVRFVSTSTPSEGQITALDWDFDGDGDFADAQGPEATWVFGSPGSHTVQLRATQTNGRQSVAFATVDVSGRPRAPRRIRPFPVIRMAGVVLPRAALVRILSVRAPRGAVVRVRCRGRGCPVRSLTRRTGSRPVRLRRFERRLRAGITLKLFVRQDDRIGKYTRFRIRGGRPPARVDGCLLPGRARPVRCP